MRAILLFSAVILSVSPPALAQEWSRYVNPEDGFGANYPGPPQIETSTYITQFQQQLPAKIYRATDSLGRYSTTVVDYREIEKLHNERAAKCRAANGANQLDGDSCQNEFRMEVAGATDYAAWTFMKRDGVKLTGYMYYYIDFVSGRLLQMTNPDRSRTFVAIHQHDGRLYIHEATVPPGMPEPILFMQGLTWADAKGLAIRYRTVYTEGYGEWKFPHERPAHSLRDLNTAIESVPRPPR